VSNLTREQMVTPIVSVVGKSGVGKTTLLEKLVPEIRRRGYRVAVVKHDVHGFEIDHPGKDTWRYAQAGSDAVVISSPSKLAFIKQTDHDATLGELAQLLGDGFDLILTEGYKQGNAPKVEVHRKEAGPGLLCREAELVALATDEPLDMAVPQYDLDDVVGLADRLQEVFLIDRPASDVRLFVDGTHVSLTPFVSSIIANGIYGMVTTLRGVDDPRRIQLAITFREGGE